MFRIRYFTDAWHDHVERFRTYDAAADECAWLMAHGYVLRANIVEVS